MTHPPASFSRASLVSEALGGNFHGFLSDFLWTSCSFLYEDQGEMISYIYSFPFLFCFFSYVLCVVSLLHLTPIFLLVFFLAREAGALNFDFFFLHVS